MDSNPEGALDYQFRKLNIDPHLDLNKKTSLLSQSVEVKKPEQPIAQLKNTDPALLCATRDGDTDLVNFILSRRANNKDKTKLPRFILEYQEALLLAAEKGYSDIVLALARQLGPKLALLQTINKNQENILLISARNGDIKSFVGLTRHFSKDSQLTSALIQRDASGYTILMLAALKNSAEIIDAFSRFTNLPCPKFVNVKNNEGYSAVSMAVYHNHAFALGALLALPGIHFTAKCRKSSMTPLMVATYRGALESVNVLIPRLDSSLLNQIHVHGFTTLMLAIKWGQLSIAKALIIAGARVDLPTHSGQTSFTLLNKLELPPEREIERAEVLKLLSQNLIVNKSVTPLNASVHPLADPIPTAIFSDTPLTALPKRKRHKKHPLTRQPQLQIQQEPEPPPKKPVKKTEAKSWRRP